MKRVGMRTLKTGFAVFLAALVARPLNPDNQFVLLFTALIAMDSTVSATFENGIKRTMATAVGAAVALLMVYTHLSLYLAVPVAVMLLIVVANRLKLSGSIGISGGVTILILLNGYSGVEPYLYALLRMRDTIIGIGIAMAVNLLISPPRHSLRLLDETQGLRLETHAILEKIFLYGVWEDLELYRQKVEQFGRDLETARDEITLRKDLVSQKLALYRNLVKAYEAILVYLENLSLMPKNLAISSDNQKDLASLLGHELEEILPMAKEGGAKDEIIFNYTLSRLLQRFKQAQMLQKDLEALNGKIA
ncbi:hypothetical protein ABB02_00455 [Clostridiaceae bacterium JG1575]|nr:hypothetical protein ABB02_00455 [Clostridiaceae bacterium JG1575]